MRHLLPLAALVLVPALQLESELSRRTIEKFDVVRLLIDKAKDVKLTPRQRTDLETLDAPIKWNINKLATRIDSAQRDMNGGRPGLAGRRGSSSADAPQRTPEEARAHMIADRKIIVDALIELRREYELRTGEAMALLDESQRATAAALIKKRSDELTKLLDDSGWLTLLQSARGSGPGLRG